MPFKDRLLLWLVEYVGSRLIALYSRTFRITLVGEERVRPLFRNGTNVIYAFWHGAMFPLIHRHRRHNIRVLVSLHRDGEIITRVVEKLGYTTARGSSTRGGGKAMLELKESLAEHCNYAFTPDGPNGPYQKAKPGVIFFAQASGLPVIPVNVAVARQHVFGSWDRFRVPFPFSRVVVVYGEPWYIIGELTEADLERHCVTLEEKLRDLAGQAENELRHSDTETQSDENT
jgi:lysophospholipid acyltransferase (LPLAT)-like uncharacterized protein